jgi:hypothetical protein
MVLSATSVPGDGLLLHSSVLNLLCDSYSWPADGGTNDISSKIHPDLLFQTPRKIRKLPLRRDYRC